MNRIDYRKPALTPLVITTPDSTLPSTPSMSGVYSPLVFDIDHNPVTPATPSNLHLLSPVAKQAVNNLLEWHNRPLSHVPRCLPFRYILPPTIPTGPLIDARGHPFDPVTHFTPVHTHNVGLVNAEARWHKLQYQVLRGVKGKRHGDDVSAAMGSRLAPAGGDILCGVVRILPEENKWKFWELDRIDQITYVGVFRRDKIDQVKEIHLIRQHPESTSKNISFLHKRFTGMITEVPTPRVGGKEAEPVIVTKNDALEVFRQAANEAIKQNNLQVDQGRTYVRYYQYELKREKGEPPMRLLLTRSEGIKAYQLDEERGGEEGMVVRAGMRSLVLMTGEGRESDHEDEGLQLRMK